MEDPPWDRTVFNVTLKFRRWLSVIRRDETRSVSQPVWTQWLLTPQFPLPSPFPKPVARLLIDENL